MTGTQFQLEGSTSSAGAILPFAVRPWDRAPLARPGQSFSGTLNLRTPMVSARIDVGSVGTIF